MHLCRSNSVAIRTAFESQIKLLRKGTVEDALTQSIKRLGDLGESQCPDAKGAHIVELIGARKQLAGHLMLKLIEKRLIML